LNQVAVYQNILEWKSGLKIFDEDKFPDMQDCACTKTSCPKVHSRNMPFKGVQPRGKDGGILKDKKARLQMHEAAIERGELHLHQGMKSFAEKLCAFPEVEHDDDIDALIYCLDESYNNGLSTATTKDKMKTKSAAIVGNILEEKF
jgi:phage terminase large subunit-like protein